MSRFKNLITAGYGGDREASHAAVRGVTKSRT